MSICLLCADNCCICLTKTFSGQTLEDIEYLHNNDSDCDLEHDLEMVEV